MVGGHKKGCVYEIICVHMPLYLSNQSVNISSYRNSKTRIIRVLRLTKYKSDLEYIEYILYLHWGAVKVRGIVVLAQLEGELSSAGRAHQAHINGHCVPRHGVRDGGVGVLVHLFLVGGQPCKRNREKFLIDI